MKQLDFGHFSHSLAAQGGIRLKLIDNCNVKTACDSSGEAEYDQTGSYDDHSHDEDCGCMVVVRIMPVSHW